MFADPPLPRLPHRYRATVRDRGARSLEWLVDHTLLLFSSRKFESLDGWTRWLVGSATVISALGILALVTAIALVVSVFGVDGTQSVWHLGAGHGFVSQGEYPRAIGEYTKAIRLDPQSTRALLARGHTYELLDDEGAALRDYEQALALAPTSAEVHEALGALRSRMGRFAEAESELARAIALDPDRAEAFGLRGHARLRAGDPGAAVPDLNRAIELDPDDAWFRALRGWALAQLRRSDEAIVDFSRAIELDPDGAIAYAGRALQRAGGAGCASARSDLARAKAARFRASDYQQGVNELLDFATAYIERACVGR